jgi:subtilisin family serine protease
VPGTVVVRLRNAASLNARATHRSATLDNVRRICGTARINPIISTSPTARATASHPLASIYRIETNETDLPALIERLQQLDEVQYAEPYYLLQPLGALPPNDPAAHPQRGQQDYLTTVHAYEAWAIESGDPNVIIGMLDTGVELDHPDLTDNLYVNVADPINGLDDDGDGYVDNHRGWDMADHDANPSADLDGHGTGVTGVAAATPDNGTGIAGLGYRSSYMPIKVFRSGDGRFAFGYEAIAYAADRGCRVINLSWGGANAYSQFGQDVINYAVQERDVVVVAAAGNSGRHERYYPASYDGVLSVAVTDTQDRAVAQTTHNYWVDLVAPGQYSYSTQNGGGYHYGSGSSLAAPLVAGAAALVRARFPQWSAPQVMQQLRLSTDDIYHHTENAAYPEQLGYGRLNAARALQALGTPALRVSSLVYTNPAGAYAYYGDTLALTMDYRNWLSPATNVTVTLSSPSPYVTLVDSVVHLGAVDSLARATHREQPFRVYLHNDLPPEQELLFRVGFSAGDYQDYQYVRIISSSDHATVSNGALSLRVHGNGTLGSGQADGLRYRGQVVASPLGLAINSSPNGSPGPLAPGRVDQYFTTTEAVKVHRSPVGGTLLRSSFANATQSVSVQQTWLADTSADSASFIVGEYRVTNTGDAALTDLHVGLFTNWSLGEGTHQVGWDSTYRMAYAYDAGQQRYGAVALLTEQPSGFYTSDQPDGPGSNGGAVTAAVLDTLATRQSAEVALALLVGRSLVELKQAIRVARAYYQRYRRRPLPLPAVPVCAGQSATVRVAHEATLRFYRDPLGADLLGEGASYRTGAIYHDTAVYVAPVRDGFERAIRRMPVLISEPIARFTVDAASNPSFRNDTLFLDELSHSTLRFADDSRWVTRWEWDFGNGSGSSEQHPTARFTEPGRYLITLTGHGVPGCTHQASYVVTVVRRSERPLVSDRRVVAGDTVTLRASNTPRISVYADELLTQRLFTGERYKSEPLHQTTDLWVVNVAGPIPSLSQRVRMEVSSPLDSAEDSVGRFGTPSMREEERGLTIYPNPTAGTIGLANRYWAQEPVLLELLSPLGRSLGRQRVFYEALPQLVDLRALAGGQLPEGVYLLRVQRGSRLFVRKVYVGRK